MMADVELTEREERFAVWSATPRGDRRPETLAQLADELDIHVSQLYRWRRRPKIRERILDIVDEAVGGPERVAQILEKVAQQALSGLAKQQEIFLKYAGVLVERKEVKQVEADEISEMSDEDVQRERDKLRLVK